MALTMTRTRTQTTLTRLAQLLANLNGELEFVERLLTEMREHVGVLTHRRDSLISTRDAVAVTIQQFDPKLPLDAIGSSSFKRTSRGVQNYIARVRDLGEIALKASAPLAALDE